MFAVVFEVQPKPECFDTYLDLAKHLKPLLEKIDGFIENERFESERTQGLVLSLSTWRDEKALVRWRTQGEHHCVQEKGRFEVFQDYHLRVGDMDGPRMDVTEVGRAQMLTITEITPARGAPSLDIASIAANLGLRRSATGLVDHEMFSSIYTPGKVLLLASWETVHDGESFTPKAIGDLAHFRHRKVTVIRDYGMKDRREAPQYYAAI